MVVGSVDPVRARAQHARLLRTIEQLGARVDVLPFVHGAFDCVFAKDNAIYVTKRGRAHAVMGLPRHEERKIEQAARARDLRRAGLTVDEVPATFEGGDLVVLPGRRGVLLGHGFRSHPDAVRSLEVILGVPVFPLELVDPGLYHLDTALAALDDGTVLVCDDALAPTSRRALRALDLPDVIAVSRAEAMRFALNFVEVNGTIVSGTASFEVAAVLATCGKQVISVALDEFQRAGGSAACLLSLRRA
jgi:N-dimethylarginine dimethylaminohydrolase